MHEMVTVKTYMMIDRLPLGNASQVDGVTSQTVCQVCNIVNII